MSKSKIISGCAKFGFINTKLREKTKEQNLVDFFGFASPFITIFWKILTNYNLRSQENLSGYKRCYTLHQIARARRTMKINEKTSRVQKISRYLTHGHELFINQLLPFGAIRMEKIRIEAICTERA